jgi:hypothetical protein
MKFLRRKRRCEFVRIINFPGANLILFSISFLPPLVIDLVILILKYHFPTPPIIGVHAPSLHSSFVSHGVDLEL